MPYINTEFVPIRPNQVWRGIWDAHYAVRIEALSISEQGAVKVAVKALDSGETQIYSNNQFYTYFDIDFPDNDLYVALSTIR